MLMDRIAIGTANFWQEYNGHKVKDVDAILDFCMDNGIRTIETGTVYGYIPPELGKDFDLVVKIQYGDDPEYVKSLNPRTVMAHNIPALMALKDYKNDIYTLGASIYDFPELLNTSDFHLDTMQVPYSLNDRRFEEHLRYWRSKGVETHVRSVFMRGKLLDHIEGWDFRSCIDFVLMNRDVDKLIMGVDSLDMLKNNVYHLMEMEESHKKYNGEIDLRKF